VLCFESQLIRESREIGWQADRARRRLFRPEQDVREKEMLEEPERRFSGPSLPDYRRFIW
jgi:hypothetical protein